MNAHSRRQIKQGPHTYIMYTYKLGWLLAHVQYNVRSGPTVHQIVKSYKTVATNR